MNYGLREIKIISPPPKQTQRVLYVNLDVNLYLFFVLLRRNPINFPQIVARFSIELLLRKNSRWQVIYVPRDTRISRYRHVDFILRHNVNFHILLSLSLSLSLPLPSSSLSLIPFLAKSPHDHFGVVAGLIMRAEPSLSHNPVSRISGETVESLRVQMQFLQQNTGLLVMRARKTLFAANIDTCCAMTLIFFANAIL